MVPLIMAALRESEWRQLMVRIRTLFLFAVVALLLSVSSANGQTPVFKDYRGVTIGMSADEVRKKIDDLQKGDRQDFLVLSDQESAQIYYDDARKVTAISVDYFGNKSKPPTPEAVLGTAPQPKADGSIYQLNRYPEAGYWVSYNRTAGSKPIVTITMQQIANRPN
jgi:hypothetical protein